MKIDGRSKFYKKFLMTKLFKEEEERLPKYKKVERATILAKLKSSLPAD